MCKCKQGAKQKVALEFIDIHARDVFKTPEFRSLPAEEVLALVKRNTLNIPEVCVCCGGVAVQSVSATNAVAIALRRLSCSTRCWDGAAPS